MHGGNVVSVANGGEGPIWLITLLRKFFGFSFHLSTQLIACLQSDDVCSHPILSVKICSITFSGLAWSGNATQITLIKRGWCGY